MATRRRLDKPAAEPRPFRPGWAFKDGKLLMFDSESVLVLRGWPECRAWKKTTTSGWAATRPVAPVISVLRAMAQSTFVARRRAAVKRKKLPYEARFTILEARSAAARRFMEPFPADKVELVRRFPERHWHMLALLARCPAAIDVARDNPALAFAMASSWVFRERPVSQPLRSARSLVTKRRAAILDWLDFPASPAVVRILAKMPASAVSIRSLLHLRTTLRSPSVPKALHHLRRLDSGVLRIVTDPTLLAHVTFSFLEDVAVREPAAQAVAYDLQDVVEMHRLLFDGAAPPPLRSLAALQILHDELTPELNGRDDARRASLPLPAPPVPGTDSITPLASARDVIEEGRRMRHCVGSYVERVAAGATYIYRVQSPERATLSLVRRGDGWKLGQLVGLANEPVSAATRAAVARWLGANRVAGSGGDGDEWQGECGDGP